MRLKIHTQHINPGAELEEKVNRTVEKLTSLSDKLNDESTEIKVDLIHESAKAIEDAFGCNITIFAPYYSNLRAEGRADSIETAIDQAEEKMRKQIEHYKAKLHHKA